MPMLHTPESDLMGLGWRPGHHHLLKGPQSWLGWLSCWPPSDTLNGCQSDSQLGLDPQWGPYRMQLINVSH